MKIVPHARAAAGLSNWVVRFIAAGARWVKITDAPDVAYALAEKYPQVSVIYRRVDTRQLGDWMRDFPDPAVAGEMMARLFGDIAPLPNLLVEGINEPVLNSVAEADYLGRAEARRARVLAARGLRSIVGNFATGNPQNLMFVVFLRAFLGNGGTKASPVGVHEYGVIDIDPAADGHNMMGHRRLAAEAGTLAAGLLLVVTETGLDEITVGGVKRGGGWRSQGVNEERYLAWLLKAADGWQKDKAVQCACLFSYRDTERWKDYEMEQANIVNSGLIAAARAGVSVPLTEVPLFEFNGFGRSLTLYKDRACTVVDRKLFADWTVQVFEIDGASWRVTRGAAGLWMRPVALRAL